jgi:hypothetical protein
MNERPALLAQLKTTLRTLEQQEEAIICRAEELGDYIPRRDNADPAVVLAYDPEGKTNDPKIARGAGMFRVLCLRKRKADSCRQARQACAREWIA